VVLQCHNIGDKEPAWWKTLLTNRVLHRADRLIVHAATERESAERRGVSPNRIVNAFLPIHELGGAIPSRQEAKEALGLSGDVALCFGHVRPFKAVDVAIEAWGRLKSSATLAVAGEVWWNDEAKYRAQVERLGLGERVRLDFRFIPDEEIALWFAAADVVLAPYRIEAQSGVVLTALHFDRPVIASRVGGMPEIVEEGKNGLLVPVDDPEALAAAIDRFFNSADRSAMEKAASEAKQKYSWSRYGSVLERSLEFGV
jgi:D-inositol-3-phosphate glycosyltransferase